jgi:signal transduction histidine kinase
LRIVADQGLPPVHASAAALRHGLDVLVANAAEHGAGTVTVQARAAAGGLAIDVSDEGSGPPAGADPFRRRSAMATGRGIGLAMARSLIDAEGGRLVLSRPGPQPCFTLLLPESTGEPPEG